jgi:hypothetical protein
VLGGQGADALRSPGRQNQRTRGQGGLGDKPADLGFSGVEVGWVAAWTRGGQPFPASPEFSAGDGRPSRASRLYGSAPTPKKPGPAAEFDHHTKTARRPSSVWPGHGSVHWPRDHGTKTSQQSGAVFFSREEAVQITSNGSPARNGARRKVRRRVKRWREGVAGVRGEGSSPGADGPSTGAQAAHRARQTRWTQGRPGSLTCRRAPGSLRSAGRAIHKARWSRKGRFEPPAGDRPASRGCAEKERARRGSPPAGSSRSPHSPSRTRSGAFAPRFGRVAPPRSSQLTPEHRPSRPMPRGPSSAQAAASFLNDPHERARARLFPTQVRIRVSFQGTDILASGRGRVKRVEGALGKPRSMNCGWSGFKPIAEPLGYRAIYYSLNNILIQFLIYIIFCLLSRARPACGSGPRPDRPGSLPDRAGRRSPRRLGRASG